MKRQPTYWDGDFANIKYQNDTPNSTTNDIPSNLSVKQTAFWSYYGPTLDPQGSALPASFREWAVHSLGGDVLPRLLPFLRRVNQVLADRGLSSYWLTLRATCPTDEFDTPRWHTDDLFFSRKSRAGALSSSSRSSSSKDKVSPGTESTDWKISATLLGNPTLFIPPEHQSAARRRQHASKKAYQTDHPCNSIRCVGCAMSAEAVRQDLALSLAAYGTDQADEGEFSLFKTGHGHGAVHSEPAMSGGDRIFCNVVPGTDEELRALVSQWGMEFPRSWWIAPRTFVREWAD